MDELGGAEHAIIPDRIEAGTYMVAAALTRGDIVLDGVEPDHMATIIDKLRYSGRRRSRPSGAARSASSGSREIRPQDITTSPYPGLPDRHAGPVHGPA